MSLFSLPYEWHHKACYTTYSMASLGRKFFRSNIFYLLHEFTQKRQKQPNRQIYCINGEIGILTKKRHSQPDLFEYDLIDSRQNPRDGGYIR